MPWRFDSSPRSYHSFRHDWSSVPYLPLKPGEKTPAVKGWAKPDYEGVEPVGRVGLRADGLVIVDCDSVEAAKAWSDRIGCDPEAWPTYTVKTPRGFHFYYHWTDGSPMGPYAGVLPGIDIRSGMGSYVVCPPTPGYVEMGPNDDVEDFDPSWLPERAPTGDSEGWDEIPEGRRNATLASVGGVMRKQGASPEAIATYLHGLNNTFCHPPLPSGEVVAIAHSVARYEPEPDVEIILLSDDERDEIPDRFWVEQLVGYEMPDIRWSIPGFIPEGLTLLAGRPKVGKSWFSMGLAVAVAEGGEYLGEPVEQGVVLYLALEDNPRRLKKRVEKVLAHRPLPPASHLHFATVWPRLPDGIEGIVSWITEHPETRLIIVDTLAKVRHQASDKQRGTYQDDYEALTALKRIADLTGITMLVIHHQRKMEADDVLDTVSGTTGLTGAADTILVLSKEKLQGRGRDLERDLDQPMRFDEEQAVWHVTEEQTIEVIEDLAEWLLEHASPGDEVPSRELLQGVGLWSQKDLKEQLSALRTDPRFEAASARHPLRIRSDSVGRGAVA